MIKLPWFIKQAVKAFVQVRSLYSGGHNTVSEFIAQLKRCCRTRDLEHGKRLHRTIKELELSSSLLLSSALVNMYSRCGSMRLAREVFEKMVQRDVVVWNCLILGYVENGESERALELFSSLDCEPTHVTYAAVLKACASLATERATERKRFLEKGVAIHEHAKRRSLDSHGHVASSLVNMYCKCGNTVLAREVFKKMSVKDVVLWTSLMMGYVENGENPKALELFAVMDCQPNHLTYIAVLKACAGLAGEKGADKRGALNRAVSLHEQAKQHSLHRHPALECTLVDVYSKCGNTTLSREVFDRMSRRDTAAWNSLLLGYVENGDNTVALDMFQLMDREPSHVTYVALVKACAGLASQRASEKGLALSKGRSLHQQISERSMEASTPVSSSLVNMYGKCGDMHLAREVFDRMERKDATAWNSLLLGYVENGESGVALELLDAMDCEPSHVTYVAGLKACAALACERDSDKMKILKTGKRFHAQVKERHLEGEVVVASTLVDMYSKCGSMDLARETFEKMTRKDVVTWNCLVLGYVENGESLVALELFHGMDCEPNHVTFVAAVKACMNLINNGESEKVSVLEKGMTIHRRIKEQGLESDMVVASTLVDLYGRCGKMELARETFMKMVRKDVITWTCLILGYVENGQSQAALQLYGQLDCQPDRFAYVAVLKACSAVPKLVLGRDIHATLCKLGWENDHTVSNVLVDFYGKCGYMDTAVEVFTLMHTPGTVSWNALLAGYSSLGDSSRVFCLAREMQETGVKSDAITFLCILKACNHAGMLAEAQTYFNSMHKHGVRPSVEHYTCLIDMLSRANRFDEAASLARDMPLEADGVTWKTLLGACKHWNNTNVAKVAFDSLLSGDRAHTPAAYVLMSDIERSRATGTTATRKD